MMDNNAIIDRIISQERLKPYLIHHNNDINKAVAHYKSNILISESFYPLLAILEIGLRNSIDFQFSNRFKTNNWFENLEFVRIASRFQIDRISEARTNIQSSKKEITSGRIIAELTFGFWTSLFDTKFEMTLWKNLRLAFPNCSKNLRQRKTISSKLNTIRKFRNRIFHHEPISWNINVLESYKKDMIEVINWLNKDLLIWIEEINHVDRIINENKQNI